MVEEYYPSTIKSGNFDLAAKFGFDRFVSYTLINGFNRLSVLRTALQNAILYSHTKTVSLLLDRVDWSDNIIDVISQTFQTKIVDLFLTKYPNIITDLSSRVFNRGNDKIALHLINKFGVINLFYIAVRKCNPEITRIFLKRGSWTTSELSDLLDFTLYSARLDIVEILRTRVPTSLTYHPLTYYPEATQYLLDNREWTQEELNSSLVLASTDRELETVRILSENLARDIRDNASTNASLGNDLEMVKILLEFNTYSRAELERNYSSALQMTYQEVARVIKQKLDTYT